MSFKAASAILTILVFSAALDLAESLKCYKTMCMDDVCEKTKVEDECEAGVTNCIQTVQDNEVLTRVCHIPGGANEADGCYSMQGSTTFFVCFCSTDLCNDEKLLGKLKLLGDL